MLVYRVSNKDIPTILYLHNRFSSLYSIYLYMWTYKHILLYLLKPSLIRLFMSTLLCLRLISLIVELEHVLRLTHLLNKCTSKLSRMKLWIALLIIGLLVSQVIRMLNNSKPQPLNLENKTNYLPQLSIEGDL